MASTSTQFGAREQHLASQAGPGPLALLPFPWPRHITSPGAAPRPVIHPLWGGYTQVCGCDMDRHSALITPATERGGAWDSVWPLGEQLQERMPGREGSRKRKMQGPRPGLTARYPKQGLGPASLGEGLPTGGRLLGFCLPPCHSPVQTGGVLLAPDQVTRVSRWTASPWEAFGKRRKSTLDTSIHTCK